MRGPMDKRLWGLGTTTIIANLVNIFTRGIIIVINIPFYGIAKSILGSHPPIPTLSPGWPTHPWMTILWWYLRPIKSMTVFIGQPNRQTHTGLNLLLLLVVLVLVVLGVHVGRPPPRRCRGLSTNGLGGDPLCGNMKCDKIEP